MGKMNAYGMQLKEEAAQEAEDNARKRAIQCGKNEDSWMDFLTKEEWKLFNPDEDMFRDKFDG